jgi:Xaa-Pro aminopeptidase
VWFGAAYVFYLSGFAFIPTERPIALALSREGEAVLFVPRLELEHARAYGGVDRVVAYPEYPGDRHPMALLAELLQDLGVADGPLAGDADGYGRVMGYAGPPLSTLLGVHFESAQDAIEGAMQVKSPAEIALIRASAHWAGVAHRLLQDGTRVGASETEVSQHASAEAGRMLRDASGGRYRALAFLSSGPSADYRGQVGAHSAFPHALDVGAVFREGDILVSGATCPMFGYYSELERTMVLGEPSAELRRYFAHMLALQDLAIELCRPGVRCAEVDEAVRREMEAHDISDAWRHHVGHNIGVRYHEGPFLDRGDATVIAEGMLFTVEPGLYLEGVGGFRHSDTVLVRADGPELLTDYPRDLASLTLSV